MVADEAPQKEAASAGAQAAAGVAMETAHRAARSGPGLFTLPFWQASSATPKPIHGVGAGPCPCPPMPVVLFGRLFLP